jgi:hypothetical protein
VEYRVRDDERVPHDVMALRTERGDGIAQVVKGGDSPVTINLPLFDLTAIQSAPPSAPVAIRVGADRRSLEPGQTAQVGGLSVMLVASSAVIDERAGGREGSPYVVNIMVWRSQR